MLCLCWFSDAVSMATFLFLMVLITINSNLNDLIRQLGLLLYRWSLHNFWHELEFDTQLNISRSQ